MPGSGPGSTRSSHPAASAVAANRSARAPDRGGRVGRRRGALALAGAAEHQQVVDDLGEAIDLAEAGVEVLGLLRAHRLAARLLEAQAQARRAACAAGARRRRRTPAGRRAASRSRSVISLNVRASDRCSVLPSTDRARAEVAAGDALGGLVEPPDRPGDAARDDRAGDEPEAEHERPDEAEREPGAADRAVDGRDALRDAHRAGGRLQPGLDRDGGREDVLAERRELRVSWLIPPAQRRRDLRPVGVRGADGRRARPSPPGRARSARR